MSWHRAGEMPLPQYTNTSTAAVCAVFPADTGRLEIPLNISIDKDNKRIKKSKLTTMLENMGAESGRVSDLINSLPV
jgi:hypothetical protein